METEIFKIDKLKDIGKLEIILKKVAPEHRKYVFEPNTVSKRVGGCAINDFIRKNPGCSVLDLGTGSGALAIGYAKAGAGYVVGVEKNKIAVDYAITNARLNGVENKIRFHVGDMYEPVKGERFDCGVHDAGSMAKLVAMLTPWYTEDIDCGGEDGTETSFKTIDGADEHLNKDGCLYLGRISLADEKKIAERAVWKFGQERIIEIDKKNPQFANEGFPVEIPFHPCLYDPEALKKGVNEPHEVLRKLANQGIISYENKGSRLIWHLHMQKILALR